MSRFFNCFLALALFVSSACAKTVTYDFNVAWVRANPDGQHEREVVGINGAFPLPRIEVDKGDRVIVYMRNNLGNRNTSIHFHGLFQNGTNAQDGPSMVTQCPVPTGYTYVYNFTADQAGTYWYHSHVDGQYPDGYRAPLIIHDKDAPFEFDEEYTITLSDWYHKLINDITPSFLSLYNPSGAEPIPDHFLFNETPGRQNISIQPGKTYLFRVMNIGAFVAQYIQFENHDVTVVEIDGVYVEPQPVDWLYVSVAQRYGLLVQAKNSTDKNYAISTVADSSLLDLIPSDLQLNSTSWLEYNPKAEHPDADISEYATSDDIEAFDDSTFIPYDREPCLPDPDYSITVNVTMNNLNNGVNYAFFNNITYTPPKVPTLYTVTSAGKLAENVAVYGQFTHPFVLNHMETVEIILNNQDSGAHPFHLHGHVFQVLYRSPKYDDDDNPVPFDGSNKTLTTWPKYPAKRDTLVAQPNGNFVIRFRADNPGVWFFHCHIEWHLAQGLALTLIEAPAELQKQSIPSNHFDACEKVGVLSKGNAAGNATDFLNLAGENSQVKFLPPGFTARGIVALVFSCISAFLGMAFIAWYGLSDLSLTETKMIRQAQTDAGMIPEEIDPDDVSIHGHDGRR